MSNLITSGVSAHVQEISQELILKTLQGTAFTKAIMDKGYFAAGLRVGTGSVPLLSTDASLQDAKVCGWSPAGNVELGEKNITIKKIKDQKAFCLEDYEGKWTSALYKNSKLDENAFAQEFMEGVAASIAIENERLALLGNTSDTGLTSSMRLIDGYVTQLKAAKAAKTLSGATVIEKLQSFYKSVKPSIRSKEDFVIVVPQDLYDEYLIELANKNIFKAVEDFKLLGTNVTMLPTESLSVADDNGYVIGARYKNFIYGTNGTDESEKASIWYETSDQMIRQEFVWTLGVTFARVEEAEYAKF